jgi:hypothetical protein
MKRLWIATAAFVVFIVLGILWKTSVIHTEVAKSTVKGTDIGTPAATRLAMPDVETVNGTPNRARVDEVRRIVEAANVPINFWGKVTDQDGLPLSGVSVTYACSIDHGNDQGVAWIEQEIQRGEIGSGADGSFSILGLRGHDLTIESLTKPNYTYKMRFNHSYNFYGDAPSGRFIPNQAKPITLAMIHKDRLEGLIQSEGTLHLRGDGTPERWNLWNGEAEPAGELAVVFRADPGVSATPAQVVNWSADLEIVGGGITEAPWEEEVRRAPESGYLATVFYPKVDQKEGVPHRSFYLRTKEGKYGRIQVELSTSDDGRTARCFISADMNPRAGSRNLESSEDE